MYDWFSYLDSRTAAITGAILLPVAIYIAVSGLDDLLVDLLWLFRRSPPALPPARPESRFAILIPLWSEHQVIARMVEHNLAAIRYSNFEVFVGVYPNDTQTLRAVQELVRRHARVHLALVPHDGPTVKADCLNWIFQRVVLYEEQHGLRFESIAIHDAEDLIHPEALDRMNRHLAECDMVQTPVLPLPTPFWEFTHGVYCDDFAEGQGKDLTSRLWLGAFLPGCGVGTGFRREALDQLAGAEANRIFHPGCLTEDYDNGLRLHLLGCRQRFMPLEFWRGVPVATREYFPRTFSQAVRQRTRWITGNALQMWQEHGWLGTARFRRQRSSLYFLWRDRKGLWGNPISLLCNVLLAYAALSWLRSAWLGGPWWFAQSISNTPWTSVLYALNSFLLVERIAVRTVMVERIYGWQMALGVPFRMPWANVMNSLATVAALWRFGRAFFLKEPLRWLKTEHAYPSRSALMVHKQLLGEVLVRSGYVDDSTLQSALATQPTGTRLGEHLMTLGALSEEELYEALSLQQSLPSLDVTPSAIPIGLARALPAKVMRRWHVLPFSIAERKLSVATPEIPSDEMQRDLERFTCLEVSFHLVTPTRFAELSAKLL